MEDRQRTAMIAAFAAFLIAGAFVAPGVPFIIDGGVYLDMARAMAESGSLSIGGNGGVEDAPALVKLLTVAHDGKVMPQYPSGYAFFAAPFYMLFGVHGLMLMNALSFGLCIWLTYRLAKLFYPEMTARWSAGLFAIATFAPTYMFGIWPHMLALAFWLGAIVIAVHASRTARRDLFLLAGILVGCGVNIRVDAFLAGLIIFFWLRLFAGPRDRISPLLLFIGAAPGLIFSAWLNNLKFGTFTPFSYGEPTGLDSAARYLPIAFAAGAALIAVWAVNIPAFSRAALSKRFWPYAAFAACMVVAVMIGFAPLRDFVWRVMDGLYVLVINLQAHDAYYQEGVERNAYGHLLFWGYPKKALIQSLPWMALCLFSLGNAVRRQTGAAAGLCFLAIAAPVSFYAMNEWHGGGSYSMRYFIPALPFLAILASDGFLSLQRNEPLDRQTVLAALVAAAALYLGLNELGQANERFLAPAALYPQWAIALTLAGAILVYAILKKESARKTTAAISLFAFAYAATINVYEEIVHERTRAEQRARAADISAPLPPGALVLTPLQISLIPAERKGAFVMAVADGWSEENGAAAMAFAKAGRCVYFHNPRAVSKVEAFLTAPLDPAPLWAPSQRFEDDPRLAFFTFSGAPQHCRAPFADKPATPQ